MHVCIPIAHSEDEGKDMSTSPLHADGEETVDEETVDAVRRAAAVGFEDADERRGPHLPLRPHQMRTKSQTSYCVRGFNPIKL